MNTHRCLGRFVVVILMDVAATVAGAAQDARHRPPTGDRGYPITPATQDSALPGTQHPGSSAFGAGGATGESARASSSRGRAGEAGMRARRRDRT